MTQRKYYLRIFERFFHGETAQRFEDSPHRYAMYVLYQKLLLRSARFGGKITYRGVYADIEEQLAREFDETPDMIRTVLSYFVKLGIMVKHERYIFFPEATQLVGSECESAERVRRCRQQKQKKRYNVTMKRYTVTPPPKIPLQSNDSPKDIRYNVTNEALHKPLQCNEPGDETQAPEPQEITLKPRQIADEEES